MLTERYRGPQLKQAMHRALEKFEGELTQLAASSPRASRTAFDHEEIAEHIERTWNPGWMAHQDPLALAIAISLVGFVCMNCPTLRAALALVAFLLGFSEQSAFQRAFKRWSGTTPAVWRELG